VNIIRSAAETLQRALGHSLDQLGRDTGVIRRERKFTGTSLLRTIVLTVMRCRHADPLDYLTTASQLGLQLTERAITKRFTPRLVAFLRRALEGLLRHPFRAAPVAVPLLAKFTAVFVGDSTTVSLPEEYAKEFPGCGGKSASGKAALKVQVLWELISGRLVQMLLEPGRQHDSRTAALTGPQPTGSLTIHDLGYFDLGRFRRWADNAAFWLSRLQTGTAVFRTDGRPLNLLEHLKRHATAGPLDMHVVLGAEERLECRLIALKAPQEVADGRRRKAYAKAQKHGLVPSPEHLEWCDWTVFVTNCPEDLVTWKEVVVLYRSRWQIELLFKLWKSHNLLADPRGGGVTRQRVAELWAKMIGVILQHWLLLTTSWPDSRRSLWRAARLLRDRLLLLAEAFDDMDRLIQRLEQLAATIADSAKIAVRKKHPSWFQLLEDPGLLDW
jgi:hypothetical protein